ncbi:MAG TPA: hypothetical protein PKZ27_02960 [Rhodocyclaceae bacterium]|nr:hypothetical protein [Burkholderiaceae bacterium]HRP74526.1 hypothetical protein [Rhodocyclaceae bacterium]
MSKKETWFCANCGGLDIRHDAVVQWDPDAEEWTVLDVLDGMWCDACAGRPPFDSGKPIYAIPGDGGDEDQ